MKITFLTATGIYPESVGGPAVTIHYLYSKLKDFNVTLKISDFSRPKRVKRIIIQFIHAIKHIFSSHVVIFNSPPVSSLFPLLILSKFFRKKTIFICHGGIFYQFKGFLNKMRLQLLLLELRIPLIDYVIVPSVWLSKYIARFTRKTQVRIIPNGVDIAEIDSFPKMKLETDRNIGFVGNLSEIKGITTLLDAFTLLNAKFDYNLYLVGPIGDLDKNSLKLIRQTPQITYLGKLDHDTTISLMKSFDLLVLPSQWENFPLVILESLACGTPIVASSIGGIPEIIDKNGHNGILIPPSNPTLLAETIKNLLSNRNKLDELSMNAYNTVKNRYDWKILIIRYLKFLNNILKKEIP
ncbi:MAG: glycosyltransferase family 4 protein [Candidatus Helarchaeota archaeon]